MKLFTLPCAIAVLSLVATLAGVRADDRAKDLSIQTEFGRIVPADSWLDRKVFGQRGKPVGVTSDLALDLETGHLALVLVKLHGLDEEMPGYLAVPPAALNETDKGLQLGKDIADARLATARRLPESAYHKQLNRGWAEQQFKLFERQPYWVRRVEVKGNELPEKPVEEGDDTDKSYVLKLASNLKDIPINGQDGKRMGAIRGFAVAPKTGQIIYAAIELQQASGKLYPVPLGAFLVGEADEPWSIELDREIVANTPSFSADDWPTEVRRGWIEYVHVRYGRAAIGGVQHP